LSTSCLVLLADASFFSFTYLVFAGFSFVCILQALSCMRSIRGLRFYSALDRSRGLSHARPFVLAPFFLVSLYVKTHFPPLLVVGPCGGWSASSSQVRSFRSLLPACPVPNWFVIAEICQTALFSIRFWLMILPPKRNPSDTCFVSMEFRQFPFPPGKLRGFVPLRWRECGGVFFFQFECF